MSTRRLTLVVGLAVAVGLSVPAAAGTQARISGTVTDSNGNALPNAVITITSNELPSYENRPQVDSKGQYKVLLLDATKTYVFKVNADGYLEHRESVKVQIGTMDNELDFALNTQAEMADQQQQDLLQQPGYKEYDEGRTLLEQGQVDAAKAKLEEAVALVPDLLPAWSALMDMAYDAKEYERSLNLAKRCLEIDDEAPQCVAVAANSAENLGLKEEHDHYMALYQELNPEDPSTLFNQAVEFLNKMDDDSARPLLEKCLEVDDEFPQCLFEYGMLLLRSGETQSAKEKLQRYLEVAPDGSDAATAADTVKWL